MVGNRIQNPRKIRSGVISSVLVLAAASVVLFCRAQIVESSFEEPLSPTWVGPEGGGHCGGDGAGEIVGVGAGSYVHTGKHAVRLVVWDDGNPDAASWAGVMRVLPCTPGRRIRVGAWLYFSSETLPLRSDSQAQLKIEYFEDAEAEQLIPTHLFLSPPFDASSYKSDDWHRIEAADRAPQGARSMKFSIVVTARNMKGQREAVWLDDLFVEVQPRRCPSAEEP
jgi:hypothetical protein